MSEFLIILLFFASTSLAFVFSMGCCCGTTACTNAASCCAAAFPAEVDITLPTGWSNPAYCANCTDLDGALVVAQLNTATDYCTNAATRWCFSLAGFCGVYTLSVAFDMSCLPAPDNCNPRVTVKITDTGTGNAFTRFAQVFDMPAGMDCDTQVFTLTHWSGSDGCIPDTSQSVVVVKH